MLVLLMMEAVLRKPFSILRSLALKKIVQSVDTVHPKLLCVLSSVKGAWMSGWSDGIQCRISSQTLFTVHTNTV